MIEGGWGYIWAAYGVTWMVLILYGIYVFKSPNSHLQ